MAIDHVPEQPQATQETRVYSGGMNSGIGFLVVGLVLVVLAVGEVFTVTRMNTMHHDLTAQEVQTRSDFNSHIQTQVTDRLSALEQQNAQALDAIRTEMDSAGQRVGSQSGELKRARAMVAHLQEQQQQQVQQLQQQLAQKADQQQVGALTQDVSTTKTDLSTTKQNVNAIAADLGMARSQMGTLIARNHDDIAYLRKLGERDYYEFTLTKNKPTHIAGVALDLKKTNTKHYRYTMAVTADDVQVEKKDRNVNEPVDFFVNGSRKPYELVVNSVGSDQVKGYISTPKGATVVAERAATTATH